MRYLMGAAFGLLLCLLFLGFFSFQEYQSAQSSSAKPSSNLNPSSESKPDSQVSSKARSKAKPNHQPLAIKQAQTSNKHWQGNQSQRTKAQSQTFLYRYKDAKGRLVISNQKPLNKAYSIEPLDNSGYSVIDFVPPAPATPKSKKRSARKSATQNKTRYRYHSDNRGAIGKERLVATNSTKCRWLVGRAKGLLQKISANQNSRRSIWCDEYDKRLAEMRRLRSQGETCAYAYGYPSSCR